MFSNFSTRSVHGEIKLFHMTAFAACGTHGTCHKGKFGLYFCPCYRFTVVTLLLLLPAEGADHADH